MRVKTLIKPEVRLLSTVIDCSALSMVRRARLVQITGTGVLRAQRKRLADYRTEYSLTLNGVPLFSANQPPCPTTASILSVGYGIENADSPELRAVSDAINADFVSLEQSIEATTPLLGLLESGLYIIADCDCYPTDGDGRFFWDQSLEPRVQPATGMVFTYDSFNCVERHPVYLYPGQSASCYNHSRVDYYRNRLNQTKERTPRAIAFHFEQFMNCLLDGHHKAAAACLDGMTVPTLVIIPVTDVVGKYTFSKCTDIQLLRLGLFDLNVSELKADEKMAEFLKACYERYPRMQKRMIPSEPSKVVSSYMVFEPEYTFAAKQYPTVYEYADMIASGITLGDCRDDKMIEAWLANPIDENQQKLKTALFYLENRCDKHLKSLALNICQKVPNCSLKVQAYHCLSKLKNDPEIENLFVDYLVNCDDPHDSIRAIVDAYWD